jgi:hypothetical protein
LLYQNDLKTVKVAIKSILEKVIVNGLIVWPLSSPRKVPKDILNRVGSVNKYFNRRGIIDKRLELFQIRCERT